MKRLLIISATTLLVLSVWPSATGAQNWQRGGQCLRTDGNFGCMVDNLDLTESQKIAVEELTAAHRAERPARRQAMRDLRDQIFEEVNADNPDSNRIGDLMLQKKALREEAMDRREEIHSQILEVLDDDQKVEFLAMKERRDGWSQGRRGRGSSPGFRSGNCLQDGPQYGVRRGRGSRRGR